MLQTKVRDAVAVQGLFLLFGFVIASFFPFFALYLEGFHGLSESQIGLVIAASAAARLVANPIWGHLGDAVTGRLIVLRIGLFGSAIAALALNMVDTLGAVALVAGVHAAFMVAHGPSVDAIALVHLGDERMSEYGRIRGWESATYALGCLVFGATLQAFGVGHAMPIYAITALAIVAWTWTISRDRPHGEVAHGKLGTVGAVFRAAPRFWVFLVAVLLVWTGFNAAWNFIALRISDVGGGPLLIGLGTALGGLAEVPTMRTSSRLQERFGLRKVFALGCLVYAGGFLIWGIVDDATILSLLTVFEGVAFSLLFTTGVVIVGRMLPKSLYSTGNAITGMVGFGIGPIIGAGLGGYIFEHAGPVVLYSGASVLALGGAAVAWFALGLPALENVKTVEPVTVQPDAGPLV